MTALYLRDQRKWCGGSEQSCKWVSKLQEVQLQSVATDPGRYVDKSISGNNAKSFRIFPVMHWIFGSR